jgi:hypothetical protein
MHSRLSESTSDEYNSMNRAPHTLASCASAEALSRRFEESTGCSLRRVVGDVIAVETPQAVFAVGSFPLGMASSGSDVDLIALVDSKAELLTGEKRIANSARQLQFSSESDWLLAGIFMNTISGILVELQVAITPSIHDVYSRLRTRGPELSETEIRTLARVSSGWLLWETEGYMERNRALLSDPALGVYCCTKHFVSALHEIAKASRAVNSRDPLLALQLGRTAIEKVYLAYFASEGLSYLGSKWLAQLGHAYGAPERIRRHPLLGQGIVLMFPHYSIDPASTTEYLRAVREFTTSMRILIEQKTLFKIALHACPQVHSL